MEYVIDVCEQDKEYMTLIEDLIDNEELRKLDEITHHHHTTRFKHSLFVSYVSFKIAKQLNLNTRAIARAGLLHDFFLEGREEISEMKAGSHNYVHPKLALENARKITEISDLEEDIILKHMFLTTKCAFPRYRESFIVTTIDKYCAIAEVTQPSRNSVKTAVSTIARKFALPIN